MAAERRYDLDWLRTLGMVGVFLFHIGMFMNSWGWHVKNEPGVAAFDSLNRVMIPWIMPLFFVISGIGAYYALQRRSGGEFAKERFLRLGVPVLFGAFILSPHQVWIERLTHGQFTGNLLQFLPHYFDGLYEITPGGNFAWMGLHLWYLFFLLLFSLITLPLVQRMGLWERVGRLGAAGMLLLPAVVLAALRFVLDPEGVGKSITGWPILLYLAFYLIGAGLFPLPAFRQAVQRYLPLVVLGAVASLLFYVSIDHQARFGLTAAFAISAIAWVLSGWFSLLALFGLAERFLTKSNGLLQYGSGAVMPVYMLHQPVIVLLGLWVRSMAMAPALKFVAFGLVAFAVTIGLHHFVVRPFEWVGFLFGIKGSTKKASAQRAA